MKKRFLQIIIILFFATSLWSRGFHVMGTDSRSAGLAGALAGETIGAEAAFYNPAGFGFMTNQNVFLTYFYSKPYLHFTPDDNKDVDYYTNLDLSKLSDSQKQEYYEAIYRIKLRNEIVDSANGNAIYRVNGFSLGVEVPFGSVFSELAGLKDLGSFGLVLYSSRFNNSIHLPLLSYDTPYYLNYSYRPLALDLNIGAGVNLGSLTPILKGLSVGGGVNLFLDVTANIGAFLPDVTNIFSGGNVTALNIYFATKGYVDEPYAMTPLAGIQYKVNNNLKLGLVYRSKFYIKIDADAAIHIRSLNSSQDYFIPANIKMNTFYDPDQFGVGGSYKVTDNLELMFEADYNRWSQYIYPFMTMNFKTRDLKKLASELGFALGVTDTMKIGLTKEDEQKLKDTITIRIGAEWKVAEKYIFDFGYAYDQNPLVNKIDTTKTNLLAADTHIFSFAFFYKLKSNTTVGLHAQYQYLVSTHYTKDSTYKDFYNPNDPLDTTVKMNRISNPGYPGYTVSGGYLNVGLTVTRRWGSTQ